MYYKKQALPWPRHTYKKSVDKSQNRWIITNSKGSKHAHRWSQVQNQRHPDACNPHWRLPGSRQHHWCDTCHSAWGPNWSWRTSSDSLWVSESHFAAPEEWDFRWRSWRRPQHRYHLATAAPTCWYKPILQVEVDHCTLSEEHLAKVLQFKSGTQNQQNMTPRDPGIYKHDE